MSIDGLRILFTGNVANNAYVLASALRRLCGVEVDVFTQYYFHYVSQPEWEDADIPVHRFTEIEKPDWSTVDLKGFVRPDWYFEDCPPAVWQRLAARPAKSLRRLSDLSAFGVSRSYDSEALRRLIDGNAWQHDAGARRALAELYRGWSTTPSGKLEEAEWRSAVRATFTQLLRPPLSPMEEGEFDWFDVYGAPFRELFHHYDLVVSFGVWQPMYPLLFAPAVPRVNLEHGSIRDDPFAPTPVGRLLALAYKTSQANIITNPDAIHTIRRLGLEHCTFIPHPVDETKFRAAVADVRTAFCSRYGCDRIILAPARHDWAVKGNDRLIRAFARARPRLECKPLLVLFAWGQEPLASANLANSLGLRDAVVWLPPLPKRRLAEYMHAADIVADQFSIGCFGTTTPEAMACGKPVLLNYSDADNAWAFPERPPIVTAAHEEEIADRLVELLEDPNRLAAIGAASSDWYDRHHALPRVVEQHLKVYEDALGHSTVVSVPHAPWFEHAKERVMHERAWALVRCRQPVDAKGVRPLLRQIAGKTVMEILAARLAQTPAVVARTLFIDVPDPPTEAAAKRAGFSVVVMSKRRLSDLVVALTAATCRWFVFFSSERPFVDHEAIEQMLVQASADELEYLRAARETDFFPVRVVARRFVLRTMHLRLAMLKTPMSWWHIVDVIKRHVRVREFEVTETSDELSFRIDQVPLAVVKRLGGPEFSLRNYRRLVADRPGLRAALHADMQQSSEAHLVNTQLNELERAEGCEVLQSFPQTVGLNMTSVCNAHCTFCSYQPKHQPRTDFLTLADLQRMTWLRYVRELAVWAGIGDTLVNREFPAQFRYLRATFPHLVLSLSTNGIAMTDDIAELLVGDLNRYNVSFNAARRETWERLMRARGYDNVVATTSFLTAAKLRRNTSLPDVVWSFVATKENITEVVEFVELAHKVGVNRVTLCHFVPTTLVQHRDLPKESSLYYARELCDDWFGKAEQRAVELGLPLSRPPPFSNPDVRIYKGARVTFDPVPCYDPWRTCYLTVDENGRRQMVYCCSGFYYDIDYDKSALDEDSFLAAWNHPTARYFRRTVNKGGNPICDFCQKRDANDPTDDTIFKVAAKIEPVFRKMNEKARVGLSASDPRELEVMMDAVFDRTR